MSKERTEKTKNLPAKVEKETAIRPRRRNPTNNFLATFDNLLDDFRQSFRDSFWTPWDWAIEPFHTYDVEFPVRAAYSDLIDEGNKSRGSWNTKR